ncbi:RNA-binding S4 domain-containing protein [Prolixibacter sp. NT017]|uniref:RNA-binding S4 domain-containing protein n=1 Tax=Prolixibacter sp. NT017 TaxID=2652390 RepID=UPI0012758886|nr:RNA-binding S4 domain-containing protein [Prolixibacter sp. NT017]GET27387.1 RNA-binding protein [Prolixibacter sp. NT017]
MEYALNGTEFIELVKLLKLARIAESGGQAKLMVEDGEVKRNGEVELRKRAKIRAGEMIEIFGEQIRITE